MGEINIESKVNVKNFAELIDIANDLSHYIDVDNNGLSDHQYNELSAISDKLNEWAPILEVTNKWSGKEAEL